MQQTKFNFKWRRVVKKYKQISSSEVLQSGCSDINISTIYQKKQQLVMFERKFLIGIFLHFKILIFQGILGVLAVVFGEDFFFECYTPLGIMSSAMYVNGKDSLVKYTQIFCKMMDSTSYN